MAIAFDNSTPYTYNSGRTVTQSHTASGTDRIVFVHVTAGSNAASVSAATYGGFAMTSAGSAIDTVSGGLRTYLYYYINPPTGSQTVSVTTTGGNPGIVISTVSYTGVDQTSPIDAVLAVAINASRTSHSSTVTTTTADCWIISTARFGSGGAITAGASTTVRTQPEVVFAGAGAIWDSGAARATGSNTVTVTCASQFVGGTVTVGFKPAAAAASTFKTATVNASDVPSTQTDFPSYVDLSRLGITTLAEAQSVRVYADEAKTTEWAREIVSATEMHVKIPSLTTTTDIYVDYDGVRSDYAVGDTYGRNAVWSDYEAVYHFEANSNDSTSNARNGTDTNITYGTAKIGNGAYNTSKNGKIAVGSWSLNSAFSVSGWVKLDVITGAQTFFSTYNGTGTGSGTAQGYNSVGGGELYYSNFSVDSGPAGSTDFTAGTWGYAHYTHDGTTVRLYLDGVLVDTGTVPHATTTRTFNWMSRGDETTQRMDGYIDECRVINSQFSANWITTETNNQSDEASFWGTWTDAGGGGGANTTNFFMMT